MENQIPQPNTSALQQRPSPASSQIARIDREALVAAFKAKDALSAFEQPTVAMAVRSVGRKEVLAQMTMHITKAFKEYFSESQAMEPQVHASFAETIIDDYPHESVADVVVFIKNAARGKYGITKEVRNDEGVVISRTVTDHGRTYGRLTTTLAMDWFRQYLGEKADAIAKERTRAVKALNPDEAVSELPIVHDAVLAVMKKAHEEARKDEDIDTGRRVAHLIRTLPHMGAARMRLAWKRARTRRERHVILEEANKRGLVEKRINEHLETKKP